MATFMAILGALRAIPQIAGYVEKLILAIANWQDAQKAQRIDDAFVQAKASKSKEDRAKAAKAIHDAFNS
jgi:hypothetical protein